MILKRTQRLILVPLTVMLLLTLLVGWSSLQLTSHWQGAIDRLSEQVAEAVIINNVRAELLQVNEDLTGQPDKAKAHWAQAKSQYAILSPDRRMNSLYEFFQDDRNIQQTTTVLNQPVFRLNLNAIQRQLEDVQAYTQFVTRAITFSMILLGFVLMAITAWDINKLVDQLIVSRDLNTTIQEEERNRLAQELHDGVVQELVDLKRDYAPKKVDNLIDNLRRVCHNLKPQVLEDLGLGAAIAFLADDLRASGIETVSVAVDTKTLDTLPKRYELPLFRVVQELCSNIKQHAKARQAQITLVYDPGQSNELRGYVQDDGAGFDQKELTTGPNRRVMLGLTGVTERIQQLGGQITINAVPEKGTQIHFTVPVTSSVTA